MKSKKIILCWLAMLLLPLSAGAGEIFSLKKSIEYGLEHSPALEGGTIKIDQADMDIKSQRGRFLPSLNTSYSHNEIFNQFFSGYNDPDYIDQKSDIASIRLNQSLFAGFENKSRYDRAKLGKEYQKAQLAVQKLDLAYQIKAAFFELLKTRYDISTITQRIKRLESDLAAARAFSDNRIAPYVYVLQAEADLEGAKQTLWQTQTAAYKYSARLKTLLGITRDAREDSLVEFDDEFEIPVQGIGRDLDYCMDKALLTRPEILLLDLQTSMAKKDSNIIKSRYYPRVNLDVGFSDVEKKYDVITQNDTHYAYWSAGLSVQLNLFDGGTDHYEKQRYLLEMDRLKTQKQQLKREIEEQVGVAFHSLEEAIQRLGSVEKALIASQESYTRQKRRFNASIGTISEVLDAQAMLVRSESIKSQTLLDCQLFMAELFHAMGLEQTSFGQVSSEQAFLGRSPDNAPGQSPDKIPGQIKPELDK